MITQHQTRRFNVPMRRLMRVLLEPLTLPEWNPAFLSVRGPREPVHGVHYQITVHGGLHGLFEYLNIGSRQVSVTWQVPGFRETGTWYLEPRRGATMVWHQFEHHGDQAELLRALAGLGLHRLAGQIATADAAC